MIDIRYYISTLKRYGRYKYFWEYQIIDKILRRILFRSNDGIYIMNEDWDYLIILDSCRYDAFEEEVRHRKKVKGRLEYKVSRGTDTPSFLLENFKNGKYNDIVYVTANPFVNILLNGKFYKIIPVWNEGWSEEYNTVLPSTVYEYTLKALKRYPNKRLIIHFMQPHYPFLTLREIKDEGFRSLIIRSKTGKRIAQDKTVYHFLATGKVSKEKVLQAYKENLKIVMNSFNVLL